MLGADYSYARPGGAALAAAGVVSVGRYLGDPGDGRCLTADEYEDLKAHHLSVWLVREATGREMLNGRAEGQNQARIAQAAISRLGLPADSVVYFTADFDVLPSQYAACDDFLRGVNDVFQDTGRIGLYAGVPYIDHVKSWSGASYWWKPGASSWSDGESTALHLEQLVGAAGGISGTDANVIYQDNHGQIGAPSASQSQETEMKHIYHPARGYALISFEGAYGYTDEAVDAIVAKGIQPSIVYQYDWQWDTEVREANARGDALRAAQAKANVAALQEAGIPVSITLTDANIDAIAKAVSTALGQPVTLDQLRSTLASLTIQVGAVK
jgi:hypothetical protein